jgi:mannose-1-phosphate guanylyltransferase
MSNEAQGCSVKQKNKKFYSIILAGGRGERLWPYSRASHPKQLLKLAGKKTLLEHTIERVRLFSDYVWVITSNDQHSQIEQCVGGLVDKIIVEPYSRNTAPAIALATSILHAHDKDALLGFFPADHYIPDSQRFAHYAHDAANHADLTETICLLGLWPTRPAIEYGYIEAYCELEGACTVQGFHEKPTQEKALLYVHDKNKFWNLGIFIGPVVSFASQIEMHAPDLSVAIAHYLESQNSALYEQIESVSIDYLVMEKSKKLSMLPVALEWNDIGSLNDFVRIKNKLSGSNSVVVINSHNNLVDVKDRLVALIGVNDLCVVEQGDVLVIARQSEVGSIRSIVTSLKKEGLEVLC